MGPILKFCTGPRILPARPCLCRAWFWLAWGVGFPSTRLLSWTLCARVGSSLCVPLFFCWRQHMQLQDFYLICFCICLYLFPFCIYAQAQAHMSAVRAVAQGPKILGAQKTFRGSLLYSVHFRFKSQRYFGPTGVVAVAVIAEGGGGCNSNPCRLQF
jgi:hypothetical protein